MDTVGNSRKKLVLVIGAGSVKCAAALGLWKVLERAGIEIDMFVGCSGGSMYAAVMALGYDVATCEQLTRELWTPDITRRRDTRSLLSALFPRLFGFKGSFGMISDEPLRRALHKPFGERTFAETRVPLRIVATDVTNGQKVVLGSGAVADAVRASVAIPYVWKPWCIDGRWLLDGCLADPLPVDVAIREGGDVILAMGFESPYPRKIRSAMRYAFQINSIYTNNLLRANYAFHNLAHHAEIIPILPEFGGEIRLFDTDKIPHVIKCGERAMEENLDYLRQVLSKEHA
ncbi:MAG TPA: patatin-like phospholipase family protein [Rhodanobacter sp.]|nr:patatin-like phospholipase family protein [Rhodanobacter sp.]